MGASVGYLEAWGLWWQGVDLRSMSLHILGTSIEIQMIWVGRIAKVATFASGLIVIIDLVGPERVTDLAAPDDLQSDLFESIRLIGIGALALVPTGFFTTLYYLGARGLVFDVIGFGTYGLVLFAIPLLATGAFELARAIPLLMFGSESKQKAWRWASQCVLTIAFSFDLLTS